VNFVTISKLVSMWTCINGTLVPYVYNTTYNYGRHLIACGIMS